MAVAREGAADEVVNVSFSLLGENFTLRCPKAEQENLQRAIEVIRSSISKRLRDTPTLTPQQAALLCAIEAQSGLQRYLYSESPFHKQALGACGRMALTLRRALGHDK